MKLNILIIDNYIKDNICVPYIYFMYKFNMIGYVAGVLFLCNGNEFLLKTNSITATLENHNIAAGTLNSHNC